MSGKLVELEIEDLAFDGKAVARMNGKVVFVDGGLPGERVLAEITRSKPRYNQARLKKLLTRSADRITPPCSHVDECGGCTWQDLKYESQLKFKKKQVVACLERLAGITDTRVGDVIGSVELFHYRNKMEFSFNRNDSGFNLGLHKRNAFDRVFDLKQCFLQPDICNRIVIWTAEYVRENNISVYDVTSHEGYMRFLVFRVAKKTTDLMVNIVTNYGSFPERQQFLAQLRQAFPEITTVVHNQNGQRSNIAVGESEEILYGTGYIEEELFDCRFRIRANAFFQTNSLQTETLYRTAFDMLKPSSDARLLDLYCGSGSIGILAAKYVSEVVGVELIDDAIEAAAENAAINKIDNITFHKADVRIFLKEVIARGEQYDYIVIDPPRAGLHPKALKRVIELRPKKLLYISCNPATFARDAATIVAGSYKLPEVQPIDMFPHTKHVELVGVFEPV